MPHAQAPLSYVATAYSLRNSAPISASHVQQRRALLIFIPFSASFLDRLNLLFTLHLFYLTLPEAAVFLNHLFPESHNLPA